MKLTIKQKFECIKYAKNIRAALQKSNDLELNITASEVQREIQRRKARKEKQEMEKELNGHH